MKRKLTVGAVLAPALVLALAGTGRADEVTEWYQTLGRSALMLNPNNPAFVTSRIGAIVTASVFDAVNDGRYQTVYSIFWQSSSPLYIWGQVAISLLEAEEGPGDRGHDRLLKHARVLALLNLAMADAAIACWDAKYHYVFWRPITAIQLADTDGNPATDADLTWVPLLTTPAFPEYPSGHSTVSGAAAAVLAHFFGQKSRFQINSDLLLGVVRSFRSFSEALDEVRNARVFGGIHFRSACDDGQAVGNAVGNYVLAQALLPQGGDDDDH